MTLYKSKRECHMAQYRSGSGFGGKQQFAFCGGRQAIDLVDLEMSCYNDGQLI